MANNPGFFIFDNLVNLSVIVWLFEKKLDAETMFRNYTHEMLLFKFVFVWASVFVLECVFVSVREWVWVYIWVHLGACVYVPFRPLEVAS